VFFVQPNIIIDIHTVKDIGRVIAKWEVNEKMLGNNAIRFILRIVVNISIIMFSVLFSVFFIVNFTSFFIFISNKLFTIKVGVFIFHIFVVVKIVTNISVNHDNDSKVELGSKMEKRFVIILFVFFLISYLLFCFLFLIGALYLLYLLLICIMLT